MDLIAKTYLLLLYSCLNYGVKQLCNGLMVIAWIGHIERKRHSIPGVGDSAGHCANRCIDHVHSSHVFLQPQVRVGGARETNATTRCERICCSRVCDRQVHELLLGSNESNEAYTQSSNTVGVGDSILLNPLSTMPSREKHRDKREHNSVTITDAAVHYHPAKEEDKSNALVINPPPQTARARHRSESTIDNTTKWPISIYSKIICIIMPMFFLQILYCTLY